MNLFQKITALPDAISGRLFVDPQRNGEHRFARSMIRDGMVVIDAGANVGDYSKFLFSLSSRLEIHCFEPVASTFTTLQQAFNSPRKGGRYS